MHWGSTGMLPTANKHSAVMPVGIAAVQPLPPCLSRSSSRGDSACLSRTPQFAWPHRHLWGLSHHRVQLDQNKELSFHTSRPPWSPPIQRMPLPPSWYWMNGWLGCAQKSQRRLDVDCSLPQEASRGGVWGRRSEQKDLPAVIGGHCRSRSCGLLLPGCLGSGSGSDPGGPPIPEGCGNRGTGACWSGGRRRGGSVRLVVSA
jgi:hypothetical protein